MSYDLYFYKPKGANISETQIANYLTDNLTPPNEDNNEWFYENKDTGVYFSLNQNEPETDPESIELYDSFQDFDNIHFSFNLNFMRPCFFGLEAFQLIEKFMKDLNLSVLDPQSNSENPYKPTKEELFDNWNKTNLRACADHFDKFHCCYLDVNKSNEIWNYNFNKKRLQTKLGEQYFVPKIFFLRTKKTNEVIAVSTWTEHIPNVIPAADYFILIREYRKMFRIVKDTILVSRQTLFNNFGKYFEEFEFKNCKIIHANNASKVKERFNALKPDHVIADFAEMVPLENLYNAKPD